MGALNISTAAVSRIEEQIKNAMYGVDPAREQESYIRRFEFSVTMPKIANVIFNDPATVVYWSDGSKTVVKCQPNDEYDREKGLMACMAKKAYGNKGAYCKAMAPWLEGASDE